jgi:hypothetical protein
MSQDPLNSLQGRLQLQYGRNSVNISPVTGLKSKMGRTGTAATTDISGPLGSTRGGPLYATDGRHLKKNRRV